MEEHIQPTPDDGIHLSGKSDSEMQATSDEKIIILGYQTFKFTPPNPIYAMAYGGNRIPSNAVDVEQRIQRLERGQKIVRRGRVMVSVPSFSSQSFISQTSGNNPFTTNKISGITFPAGQVPDVITPTTNNSTIDYPRKSDL